ncbi:SDR family oxidoreductase [Shinella sp. PSBB067]|uniref:SDR family oxidoreductase n=1 Tax=Shinella sp. PSBB067 TaxID=2715959 RepID=UPI001E44657C|nr:SDR family oxidoreductase [Shinella sp. PSBB067]
MNQGTGRLAGRVAVVTAAGQGIGRATAEPAGGGRGRGLRQRHQADLLASLQGAATARLDATDAAAAAYFSAFARIDVLVHAVGYVHQGTIEECGPEDWRRSVSITLDSAYNVIGRAVPKMKAHGGSIVTIGSVASSIKGFPRRAAYGAAKGGVIGLTKAVATDYVSFGIRCNSVCPGTVASPSLEERIGELGETLGSREEAYRAFISRQPAGRFGTVEEIAAFCAFLASDEAAFITGQAINVDGGITI